MKSQRAHIPTVKPPSGEGFPPQRPGRLRGGGRGMLDEPRTWLVAATPPISANHKRLLETAIRLGSIPFPGLEMGAGDGNPRAGSRKCIFSSSFIYYLFPYKNIPVRPCGRALSCICATSSAGLVFHSQRQLARGPCRPARDIRASPPPPRDVDPHPSESACSVDVWTRR